MHSSSEPEGVRARCAVPSAQRATDRARSIVVALFLASIVACGDSSVQTSGGGAASSQSNTGEGTGQSVSTGAPLSLCDQFCAATGTCFDDCQSVCKELQVAPCASQGSALVTCMISNYDTTTCAPTACEDESSAFSDCHVSSASTCGEPTCGGSATSCACTAGCPGGSEEKMICQFHADGSPFCTCYFGGVPLAGCIGSPSSDPNPGLACEKNGCCGALFAHS